LALKGFPANWQPNHQTDRLIPEMQAPAPWGRQPGRNSKVFCDEHMKLTASLILKSSPPSSQILSASLTRYAAIRVIADDGIGHSSAAAHAVRPRQYRHVAQAS
jgi:hypothetical protein